MGSYDVAVKWAAECGFAYYAELGGESSHRPTSQHCLAKFREAVRGMPDSRVVAAIKEGWPKCPDAFIDEALNVWVTAD